MLWNKNVFTALAQYINVQLIVKISATWLKTLVEWKQAMAEYKMKKKKKFSLHTDSIGENWAFKPGN